MCVITSISECGEILSSVYEVHYLGFVITSINECGAVLSSVYEVHYFGLEEAKIDFIIEYNFIETIGCLNDSETSILSVTSLIGHHFVRSFRYCLKYILALGLQSAYDIFIVV